MATNVIPIQDIASVGLMSDFPDTSLPPNAFSDIQNIRIHDNAIRKIKGEVDLGSFGNSSNSIRYVAFWPSANLSPSDGYYVYIYTSNNTDYVCARKVSGGSSVVLYNTPYGGTWQHTLFGGGFNLVLNNGISTPKYIQDPDGNTDITQLSAYDLPGWDSSYNILDTVVDQTYNGNTMTRDFVIGQELDTTNFELVATIFNSDGAQVTTETFNSAGTHGAFTLAIDSSNNTSTVTASSALETDFRMVVQIKSVNQVKFYASVIRTFGESLIAGNITEKDGSNTVRKLTGVIRISDVAAPGAFPTNWNPYAAGVSTADEFILSSTGIVQDIVEMQGRAYVYTNTSIHSITATGNPNVPWSLNTVTSAYGAHSMDCVVEVDGVHMVIGSNDIYMFPGHPGNIKSIAQGAVRYYFYDNINSTHSAKTRIIRYNRFNELWICFPNTSSTGPLNEVLIYNYRTNLWTKRVISEFESITMGLASINSSVDPNQYYPIMGSDDDIIAADSSYTDKAGNAYESYAERLRVEMQPVFSTESVSAFSVNAQTDTASDVDLDIYITATSNAGEAVSFDASPNATLTVRQEYKADTRINGRFLSYKITDGTSNSQDWLFSGIQVEFDTGGRR